MSRLIKLYRMIATSWTNGYDGDGKYAKYDIEIMKKRFGVEITNRVMSQIKERVQWIKDNNVHFHCPKCKKDYFT